MKIALASLSPIKYEAVAAASDDRIVRFDARSDVPKQPHGINETLRGALNRVIHCKSRISADAYIGIENGIIYLLDVGWMDFHVVVRMSATSVDWVFSGGTLPDGVDREFWVTSPLVIYPHAAVLAALNKPGGFQTNTAAEHLGTKDPHLLLCGISRKDILTSTLRQLFA